MIRKYPHLSDQDNEQRILNNISRFKTMRKLKCLECGYEGLMGYVGIANPISYLFQLIFGWIMFIILIFLGPIGIIIGILVLIGSFARKKGTYHCPNCEVNIVERK